MQEPNTTILNVSVTDTNPARARDIANTLVTDFTAEVKRMQQQDAQTSKIIPPDNFVVVAPAVLPTPVPDGDSSSDLAGSDSLAGEVQR